MTRLTADAGLSRNPTLSPDGKLVAYSSDREMAGRPDLYIQQVLGVQRIRLTFDGEGNSEPAFSPDGKRIAYATPPTQPEPDMNSGPMVVNTIRLINERGRKRKEKEREMATRVPEGLI